MNERKHPVSWPGWITKNRICGQGYGSLWELWREDGKKAATIKYISVPQSAQETRDLLRQGKSQEHITAYYDYMCREADEEYAVSQELKGCRHVALYRDMRKVRAEDGLGWDILLMMDKLLPIDKCEDIRTEAQVLKLGKQICLALEDSSHLGLLHGRITPRCIFRDEKGDYQLGGFASEYLTDFGDFRAPEIANKKFSDSRADVYSLGLVLYWLLNDRQLPGSDRAAPKNGSEQLKAVIMKAIAPKVQDRYQNPAEMQEALNAVSPSKKKIPVLGIVAAGVLVLGLLLCMLFRPEEKLCENGHRWMDATCSSPKTCEVCGKEIGSVASHKWVDATCSSPKTCEVCGKEIGSVASHKWVDATCSSPKTCEVCGEEIGSAAAHKWVDATCSSPKTCEVCGEEIGSVASHKWVDATCSSPKTCEVCGEEIGSAAAHKWVDATCSSPKTCEVCGEETGSAAGHKWKDATCVSPKTCEVCGEETGGLAEHKWMDATYTSAKRCSVCNATEGEPKENPAVDFLRERMPIVTYALGSEQRIYGYKDAALTQKVDTHYLDAEKAPIVLMDISRDGTALKVRFSTSATIEKYDTLWFSIYDIFALDVIEVSYHTTSEWLPTYRPQRYNDELVRYGGLKADWNFYVIGKQESGRAVIYYTIEQRFLYNVSIEGKIALVDTSP